MKLVEDGENSFYISTTPVNANTHYFICKTFPTSDYHNIEDWVSFVEKLIEKKEKKYVFAIPSAEQLRMAEAKGIITNNFSLYDRRYGYITNIPGRVWKRWDSIRTYGIHTEGRLYLVINIKDNPNLR